MKTVPDNKYHLRDLHQEIDFYDRKIAHCRHHESFDSEQDRLDAISKLETKRVSLVKTALAMAERGVEYSVNELPRSLRTPSATAETV